MNYDNNNTWADALKYGDIDSAEELLTERTAQRIIPHLQQIAAGQQALEQVNQITNEAGAYSQYVMPKVAERVQQDLVNGAIKTPQDFVGRYRDLLHEEIGRFRQEVRPGYERSGYTPYQPADQEVRDYIAERQALQAQRNGAGRQ